MIARVQRLNLAQLINQLKHDYRSGFFQNQSHIDNNLTSQNQILEGSADTCLEYFKQIVENTVNKSGEPRLSKCQSKDKIEKDTNLATSMLFTISKEHFDKIENKSEWITSYCTSILNQLKTDYGEDCIKSAVLHNDEPDAAPHMQVIIAPQATIKQGNRFGSKERKVISHAALFVDNIKDMKRWRISGETSEKSKLGKFQTRYAQAVAHLGIVRGEENAWHKRHQPSRPSAKPEAPKRFTSLVEAKKKACTLNQ